MWINSHYGELSFHISKWVDTMYLNISHNHSILISPLSHLKPGPNISPSDMLQRLYFQFLFSLKKQWYTVIHTNWRFLTPSCNHSNNIFSVSGAKLHLSQHFQFMGKQLFSTCSVPTTQANPVLGGQVGGLSLGASGMSYPWQVSPNAWHGRSRSFRLRHWRYENYFPKVLTTQINGKVSVARSS